MAAALNPFNLSQLASLRGGAGSRYARILGLGPNNRVYNAFSRDIFALQIQRELRTENIVRDPDTRVAIAAVNMVSGGIGHVNPDSAFQNQDCIIVIRNSFGMRPAGVADFGVSDVVQVDNLISGNWPAAAIMPCQPDAAGMIVFNADRFAQWVAQIQLQNNAIVAGNNRPSANPAGAVPVPAANEITPWNLGGYISVNITDGQPNNALIANPVAQIQEFLSIIGLAQVAGAQRRAEIINLLVLGTTIVSSGGNITTSKVRKIIVSASRETMVDVIDFSREMVLRGWDFLSLHLTGPGVPGAAAASADFQQMFTMLSAATTPVSLRLALLCQQTELKMLTALVTIVRAVRGFQDFPWTEFFTEIRNSTGVDELANVSDYANYVDPPAGAAGAGGHWSGWTFALRSQPQQNMRIAMMPHALYVSLRLSIVVGGNQALQGYQGLDNITLPARPLCDAWIMAYQGARQAAPASAVSSAASRYGPADHNL